jgi:stringent starvation protein B
LLRALYEWIVDSGEVPNVLVDAEIDGVVVPSEHVRDGQIVLNISPQAVRNLSLGNDYVMCEGRFSGRSVELILPIESVRAIYCRDSGQGLAFDDEDLLESESEGELGADVTQASQPTSGPKPPGDKPKLRLV